MTIIRGDRKKHPWLGVQLIIVGLALLVAGILGVHSGSFDYDVISPYTLDERSARIAASGACVMSLGCIALGIGFQTRLAWLELTGVIAIAVGFVVMWLGPLARWIF